MKVPVCCIYRNAVFAMYCCFSSFSLGFMMYFLIYVDVFEFVIKIHGHGISAQANQ